VGSGGIAKRRTIPEGILPASNAVLTAVFDVDKAANAAVAEASGARACASLEELLAQDVRAVYIATPAWLHREQALACFAAGKHVLCEKPLGLNAREAEEMTSAAAAAGLTFGVALMMRFQAQHQAALKLIREGRLGQPVMARAQLSCWYPPIEGAWRQQPQLGGGGSLIDMGGHTIDLLEMFFGPVTQVACITRNRVQSYATEDTAVALLAFECGAAGVVDACFCIPDEASDNVMELYGSRGSIVGRGTIGQGSRGSMVARLQGGAAGYDAHQERAASAEIAIDPPPVNPYRAEIEEFSQAILEGREPLVPGAAGVRNQRVLDACYESARAARLVEVEP
jgi:predicted dehydrogenase